MLQDLIAGKVVKIGEVKRDMHNRIVAHVYIDDIDVGYEMVKNGGAWWFKRFERNNKALKNAELEAQRSEKVIWKDIKSYKPTPPWEWRERNRRR